MNNLSEQEHRLLIKKLLYQSCNRGCRETDIIIGNFAKKHLNNMSGQELIRFSEILKISDADIYDWYTGKQPLPTNQSCGLMKKILNFNPLSK